MAPTRAAGGVRVLVVRVGAMGDVLHALPAVTALRDQIPECFIGWAIEPRWRSLLEMDGVRPVVDRVHDVPTRDWKNRPFSVETARSAMALRREMRAERYDICVDLQGSIRSAVIGRMAGAGRFVGPEEPRERVARVLYGERVRVGAEHVIGQGCELLGTALGTDFEPARARVPVGARVAGEGYVLLAPTAGWGAKMWPVERFRELALRLKAAGWRVLVNASSAGDTVARGVGAELFVCGVEGLAAVVDGAALVIGGDTGPVQMAGALGVPAVALFGPTDPARTGPQGFVGSRVRVLRDASSVVDHRRFRETEAGLARIGVEEVFRAAVEMLASRADSRVKS